MGWGTIRFIVGAAIFGLAILITTLIASEQVALIKRNRAQRDADKRWLTKIDKSKSD